MVYYGRNGTPYTVNMNNKIGSGGEGAIYDIGGKPNLVAKVFSQDAFSQNPNDIRSRENTRKKLETMLDQPIQGNLEKNGNLLVAWPEDLLLDAPGGKIVGFVMPRIKDKKPLYFAYREIERNQLFDNRYTWKKAIIVARNLALALLKLHESGAVMGDMNPDNFLLDKEGFITLIDAASFNITNSGTGKVYKCCVGIDEMMPPELQGLDRSSPDCKFSEKTDSFGLGILIFRLILNNHPFRSGSGARKASVTASTLDQNIAKGNCVFLQSRKGPNLPGVPDMRILPDELMDLFRRTFGYTQSTARKPETINARPSAREWFEVLDRMCRVKFSTCAQDKNHVYMKSYGKCPWCEMEKRRNAFQTTAIGSVTPVKKTQTPHHSVGTARQSNHGHYTPVRPRPAARPVRRSAGLLYFTLMVIGLLCGLSTGEGFAGMINDAFSCSMSGQAGQVVLSIISMITGLVLALMQEDEYKRADNGWYRLLGNVILMPLGIWVASALIILAAAMVVSVVIALGKFIAGIFLLIALLSGGG